MDAEKKPLMLHIHCPTKKLFIILWASWGLFLADVCFLAAWCFTTGLGIFKVSQRPVVQKHSAWKTSVALLIFINFTRENGTLHFPGGFFASIFRNWHGICLGCFSPLPSTWQIEDLGFDHRIEGHLEALQEGWFLMGFWFCARGSWYPEQSENKICPRISLGIFFSNETWEVPR